MKPPRRTLKLKLRKSLFASCNELLSNNRLSSSCVLSSMWLFCSMWEPCTSLLSLQSLPAPSCCSITTSLGPPAALRPSSPSATPPPGPSSDSALSTLHTLCCEPCPSRCGTKGGVTHRCPYT